MPQRVEANAAQGEQPREATALDWRALIDQGLSSGDPGEHDDQTDASVVGRGSFLAGAAEGAEAEEVDAPDAPEDEQDEQDAVEDEGGEERPAFDIAPATTVLGAIEQLIKSNLNVKALDESVPTEARSLALGAAQAIQRWAQEAANYAYEQGIARGERFAVLNELYTDDPEAFQEETKKDPAEAEAFYQWKAHVARQAGIDTEERRAIVEQANELLAELNDYPQALEAVQRRAATYHNGKPLQANAKDLRILERLVDRELAKIELGAYDTARQQQSASDARADERRANAQRLRNLPKPDVGGPGGSRGARSLLEQINLRRPGAGADLVTRALAGEFRDR